MQVKFKSLFCLILSASIASITYSSIASADQVIANPIVDSAAANGHTKSMRIFEVVKIIKPHHGINLGLNRNKNLTSQDAQTIIQAALLEKGRKDLHVGTVTTQTNEHGIKMYQVAIQDQQNKIISQVRVNSMNGKIRPLPMPQSA